MIKTIIFFNMLIFSSNLLASRTIEIVPIDFNTVHGGVINKIGCVTADLSGKLDLDDDGVRNAVHTIDLKFKNISAIPQTLEVALISGDSSSTYGDGIPSIKGPSMTFKNWSSAPILLPANGAKSFTFSLRCNDMNCELLANGALIQGTAIAIGTAQSCGIPHGCFAQLSTFHLKVAVSEDRGAVLGNVSTWAHRCSGIRDHFIKPPYIIQINGGRAF